MWHAQVCHHAASRESLLRGTGNGPDLYLFVCPGQPRSPAAELEVSIRTWRLVSAPPGCPGPPRMATAETQGGSPPLCGQGTLWAPGNGSRSSAGDHGMHRPTHATPAQGNGPDLYLFVCPGQPRSPAAELEVSIRTWRLVSAPPGCPGPPRMATAETQGGSPPLCGQGTLWAPGNGSRSSAGDHGMHRPTHAAPAQRLSPRFNCRRVSAYPAAELNL